MAFGPVSCLSAGHLRAMFNAFNSDIKQGEDYLTCVSDLVSRYRNKTFALKSPAGATWKIGNLDDTIYRGEHEEVDEWNKFYLPKTVSMQVVGVVERTSCPCVQLVLMTCEDEMVYAYDGEELHVVATNLNDVPREGIKYPASKTYFRGEAFKTMTEKDWAKVRKGAVGKSLDREHRKLVTAKKSKFLENLRSMKHNTGACSQC